MCTLDLFFFFFFRGGGGAGESIGFSYLINPVKDHMV